MRVKQSTLNIIGLRNCYFNVNKLQKFIYGLYGTKTFEQQKKPKDFLQEYGI